MEEEGYQDQGFLDINSKTRDLEEKQRIQKDRLRLLEKNLIDLKEKTQKENLSLKKDIEIIKQTLEQLTSFLETASIELQKFARKEDLELLTKQAKMFQPLLSTKKKS
jgi:hypothetical protein